MIFGRSNCIVFRRSKNTSSRVRYCFAKPALEVWVRVNQLGLRKENRTRVVHKNVAIYGNDVIVLIGLFAETAGQL
jgi:hypothetical protein